MSKKHPDRGNKRRFLKNAAQFIKNPYGYTYWSNIKFYKNANPRIMHILGLGCALTIYLHYQRIASEKTDRSRWMTVSGHNPEGNSTQGGITGYNSNDR